MFIVEINDFFRPYNDHICINIRTDGSHFGNRLPFFSQNESAMSLYPKMFLRVPHTCITNFTLVSLIAHFFTYLLYYKVVYISKKEENSGIVFKQHYSLKTASGGLKMTSEAAGTRPIIFSIKSYPCMPKAGSHSIQGMAGHSEQTRKQIPLCFI